MLASNVGCLSERVLQQGNMLHADHAASKGALRGFPAAAVCSKGNWPRGAAASVPVPVMWMGPPAPAGRMLR